VDERVDGRQMAVVHRPEQRRRPIPVQAGLGRGGGGPEGLSFFSSSEQTAALGYRRGTGRTRACRPPHVPPHQTPKCHTEWKMGLRQNGDEKNLIFGSWHGNAPVLDVKVLLALKQQFLRATQYLEHGERRHGVSSGFGDAWAVERAVQGDSGSLTSCQSRGSDAFAGGTKQLPRGGAP
jgi:hypothetical protein